MNSEKKLIKILERFRDKLSDQEIALIDSLVKLPKTMQDSWDSSGISYKLFTDGASQLDKNNAGIGGLLKNGHETVFSFAENIGDCTNNEAEYLALIRGIELCVEKKILDVKIFCDSELIVRQVNGDYKVKNERMIKLHAKVLDLCSMLNHWSVSHVLRDKNMEADLLSKEGLTK
ncbi:MAG: ribonuclease HI family protein [Candidatus Marinimicrobia bacterium]|jgi:ribonuclease HI|nr:ribonuclease HI family protein [Candidatus Neomarinimicrobiota bacterium]|tara:strand:- start:1406 stop:1930 length:525 start_codon:yes stop_codon:yes gene_type:complete